MPSPSRHAARRAVAALLALSLSGAGRVALAAAPVGEHVCQCARHGERHRCACPICAEKLRRARRGELEKLPPCHRALAEAELRAEEAEEESGTGSPCLRPACGIPDPGAPSRPVADAFALPEPDRAISRAPSAAPPREAAPGVERGAAPELPPPRA